MGLQDELERVEAAEDLFALFGLAYDPRVMRIHRLHVMQRFGQEVAAIDSEEIPDGERWKRYAAALRRAHDYYAEGTPRGGHAFVGVRQGLVQLGTRPSGKNGP